MKERTFMIIATIIIVPPLFLALMAVVALGVDRITDAKTEHERCLKRATNGYEIQRCR